MPLVLLLLAKKSNTIVQKLYLEPNIKLTSLSQDISYNWRAHIPKKYHKFYTTMDENLQKNYHLIILMTIM